MAPSLRFALTPVLLFAWGAAVAAPVDESRPLSATGTVEIENIKGRIDVRTWDRPEVRITGELGEGVDRLDTSGGSERLVIKVVYPGDGGWFRGWGGGRSAPSRIEVTVPVGASVEAKGVSADIDVQGVAGARLRASTVSGGVVVAGSPREVEAESVSGNLRLDLQGSRVSASTVSGSVRIEGAPGGRIGVETVSGDFELEAAEIERLDAETVSGRLRLRLGALAEGARISAESLSGQIELDLPAAASAQIRVSTFSGAIRSDVGEVKRAARGPGASLEARLGEGGAQVQVESFSGGVRITTR